MLMSRLVLNTFAEPGERVVEYAGNQKRERHFDAALGKVFRYKMLKHSGNREPIMRRHYHKSRQQTDCPDPL